MLESLQWGQRVLTPGWQRGLSPLDGGAEIGAAGGGRIWRQDNEELSRVSDRDTHRSLALSCKERWLSDWEGSDLDRNESSTASSASVEHAPPLQDHRHKELHYNLRLPLLMPALQGGLRNLSPQLLLMNVKMVRLKSCRLNRKSWVYFESNERTG